ncbi:hypothetical protein JY651_09500 [Pyxidicoccus parkwayensis]|uniref:Translation initiation factor IF-2 n=1 Tax=Pyxidicoccus parkwayensis TaxID=2813578 RepID=A0ABX7P3W9_9BACT|nr:hypothetical protein [Pyxidicoccus parkwaysis]QSQ25141.1 hypothetical protein JY651_09500 [Pyxidicoccus parkwaysis]
MAGENQVVPPPPKKLKKPVEVMRAELLTNKDVIEQARLLKVDLAEYVEKILDYAQNPEKPPQLVITPDEELKAMDPNAPTVQELETHLQKIIDGEIVISRAQQRDGFNDKDADARFKKALASDAAQQGAPEARKGASPTALQADPKKAPPKS